MQLMRSVCISTRSLSCVPIGFGDIRYSSGPLIRKLHESAWNSDKPKANARWLLGSVLVAVSLAILFVPMLFSATHAFPGS